MSRMRSDGNFIRSSKNVTKDMKSMYDSLHLTDRKCFPQNLTVHWLWKILRRDDNGIEICQLNCASSSVSIAQIYFIEYDLAIQD